MMNTNELIMANLIKQVHDLTYYEKIRSWTNVDSQIIHDLCVSIKSTCEIMNIIGSNNFWIHENGIKGFDGVRVDVKQRFGLFKNEKGNK